MKEKENGREQKELVSGLVWNYGSLVILSLSGFVFNCLIMCFYDATALGVFNRVYAWYCVLSQIAVMGVHVSVTPHVAEARMDRNALGNILFSALACVAVISIIVVLALEIVLPFLIVNNQVLLLGMQMVVPGLLGFSVNKVLLNYLNGLSDMKAYAFFQSMRYVLISIVILVLALLGKESGWLPFSFCAAEIILFLAIAIYLLVNGAWKGRASWSWVRRHLQFGVMVFPANMVLELNAKVDIICLGLVLGDDYLIGIYSFATLFTEGFYQIYVVIRRNINPKLTEAAAKGRLQQFICGFNDKTRKLYPILSIIAIVALTGGFSLICVILRKREYLSGILVIFIISVSIVLSGKEIIYGNIFAQTKHPIYESLVNVITVLINFTFNLAMIYFWGMYGAAAATALSYLVYGFLVDWLTYQYIGIKIKR